MRKLDVIRQSEDMRRLVELTAEAEVLKWKLIAKVEKACPFRGEWEEPLEDWEKRLDALERFLDSRDVQAPWLDDKTGGTTKPLGFIQFEVRRMRKTIQQHRDAGHTTVVEF